jgi:hypothetical protein
MERSEKEIFIDDYAEQTQKAVSAFVKRMFPQETMNIFERIAVTDILNGTNVCHLHSNRKTFQRLYPEGMWCCDECAQIMFKANILNGRIIFDMERR